MHISITPETTVQEIEAAFKQFYPELRLVLYKTKPGRFSSWVRTRMAGKSTMASAGLSEKISIYIGPAFSVKDMTSLFRQYAPIEAELRIRSGKIWKAALHGEIRTLDQLNKA